LTAVPAVGLTRVYVGAHLPLDIAGGAALGLAIDAALALAHGRAHSADSAGSQANGRMRPGMGGPVTTAGWPD
jgi:membrane-associated phospholipid phosphatase